MLQIKGYDCEIKLQGLLSHTKFATTPSISLRSNQSEIGHSQSPWWRRSDVCRIIHTTTLGTCKLYDFCLQLPESHVIWQNQDLRKPSRLFISLKGEKIIIQRVWWTQGMQKCTQANLNIPHHPQAHLNTCRFVQSHSWAHPCTPMKPDTPIPHSYLSCIYLLLISFAILIQTKFCQPSEYNKWLISPQVMLSLSCYLNQD